MEVVTWTFRKFTHHTVNVTTLALAKTIGRRSPRISEHIKIHTDLSTAIAHIGKEFRSYGFRDRFLTEHSVDYVRGFDFERPFRITGEVELSFFPYSDHVIVHYEIRNIMGASYVLLIPLLIYLPIFFSHLVFEGLDMPVKIYLPTLLLSSTFFLVRWFKMFWLKRRVRQAIDRFKEPVT